MANEKLATATRSWLETHTDAPTGLRRIIVEGLATVDRAVKAQTRDSEVNR
jgi:hypothetical protein